MKDIEITGVEKNDSNQKILGYAICRQWRDNPNDVEVYNYADSEQEAKNEIKKLPKDTRYKWFIGVYQ